MAARFLPIVASHFMITTFLSSFAINIQATLDGKPLNEFEKEKPIHLRLYCHDILSGPNPTAVVIVPLVSNSSASFFGQLTMIDNPLTKGPELNSKLIGRAQGLYGFTAQEDVVLLMAMNFVFVEGKYKGSTITIPGRNEFLSKNIRELQVLGGIGLLRSVTGYALLKTYSLDPKTGNAVVEYNIYLTCQH